MDKRSMVQLVPAPGQKLDPSVAISAAFPGPGYRICRVCNGERCGACSFRGTQPLPRDVSDGTPQAIEEEDGATTKIARRVARERRRCARFLDSTLDQLAMIASGVVAGEPGLADTASLAAEIFPVAEEVVEEVAEDDILEERPLVRDLPAVPDLPGTEGPAPLPPVLPVAVHQEPPPLRPAMAAPRTGARRHLGLHEDFVMGLLTLLFWLLVPAGAGAAPGPNWGASDHLDSGPRAWEPLSGIGVPFVLPPLDGEVTVDPLPPPPPPAPPPPYRLCEQCVRLADACGRALMAQCGLVAQASGEGSAVPHREPRNLAPAAPPGPAWHPLFGGGCSVAPQPQLTAMGVIVHLLLISAALASIFRQRSEG